MPIDEPGLVWKSLSVLGFLLLVVAYLVNQTGHTTPTSPRYLGANVVGAGLLAAYSARIDEPIFVSLEGFWCLASLWAFHRSRQRPPRGEAL